MKAVDVAIVGSGFGGSLLALIARKLGRSVALLEREQHPRFAIGESSTPLANLLLEQLARRYDLPAVAPLAKWGSWQRERPRVACGLKRGFSFFHHVAGTTWTPTPDRHNELLVAASPHDGIADTHWFRADFDHFLVQEAERAGVEYLDRVELRRLERERGASTLMGRRNGEPFLLRADLVVDATGPRGFLHHALQLPERPWRHFPPTETLYTHFTGVQRWDRGRRYGEAPPYPADDAALHHVFAGGWIWALRFNNGITSAGVVATRRLAESLRLREGAEGWSRLMRRFPSVGGQFEHARARRPFTHRDAPAYRCDRVTGDGWVLLPAAAGFVDPLLSTGFTLNLLGIERLADALETSWGKPELRTRLQHYAALTTRESSTAERLLSALYGALDDFERFTALSMLYFAAVTYTEMARRLGTPEIAGEAFLMADHPVFGPRLDGCLTLALSAVPTGADSACRELLLSRVRDAVEPVDVAGLNDPAKRNWYPASADDLLRSSAKLRTTTDTIDDLLRRSGFYGESNAADH